MSAVEFPSIASGRTTGGHSDQSGTGGSKRRPQSFDRTYVNPFKISEDSLAEVNSKSRLIASESKTMLSRTQRLHAIMGEGITTIDSSDKFRANAASILPLRHQEKEDMTDFIAKKREMFLVQMSLDTKREEIQKLEEKAQKQEKALLASEEKLKKDADEFELFLKKNDSNAQEAIRKAEEETAKKQKKSQDIKALTQQIQALSSEMAKQRDLLKTCLEYKDFLDQLTPKEWFDDFALSQQHRLELARKEAWQSRHRDWEASRRRLGESHKREGEGRRDSTRKGGAAGRRGVEEEEVGEEGGGPRNNNNASSSSNQQMMMMPAPRLEDEPAPAMDEDEPPMYFTDPQQLMDIFSALEEQNLFLIQNSQETEMTLEELRHKFMQTTDEMNVRTGQLESQIIELRSLISTEVAFASSLRARRQADSVSGDSSASLVNTVSGNEREKEELLHELNVKVRTVYESCGFDGSSRPSTLIMLSQLESELETMLTAIEKMPLEYVKNQEKEKEKSRREKKRIEQQLLQERQQEERNRRAIERSLQAPKKRTGKPIMFRSRLLRREVNMNDGADDSKENDDEIRHLN